MVDILEQKLKYIYVCEQCFSFSWMKKHSCKIYIWEKQDGAKKNYQVEPL